MKRNGVRLLSLLLSALLVSGVLASCNKRETPSPQPKTEESGERPSKTTERSEETTKGSEETTEKPEETTKKPEETTEKPEVPEKPATEGLIYELLSDETYEVAGVQSKDLTEVVIPATYNGKAVTSIGEGAFRWCIGLTSITIPNSVTSIGNSAFEVCASLTSITISDSVTSIGDIFFTRLIQLHDAPDLSSKWVQIDLLSVVSYNNRAKTANKVLADHLRFFLSRLFYYEMLDNSKLFIDSQKSYSNCLIK